MTDDQRFRLDAQLREQYEAAKADLSRQRQLAGQYGEWLQQMGAGLRTQPETVTIWKSEPKNQWRWVYSPDGFHMGEHGLPEWNDVHEVTREIGRLGAEVERLEREMRERKLL